MTDSNYLSPGVYIQELEGPAPIVGVSTSIAVFIGMAERGPVNFPILCTSPGDYTRWFGGLMVPNEFTYPPVDPKRAHCYLPYAVAGFFNNSGQIAYVIRVLPDEATAAAQDLYDRTGSSPIASALVRSAAIGDGGGATPSTGALIMLSPVPPNNTSIRIDNGSVSEYAVIQASAGVTDAVALDLPLSLSHAQGTPVAPYARATQGTPPYTLLSSVEAGQNVITVQSSDPLNTYNDLLIELNGGEVVEVAVPQVVVPIAANQYSITLTQPLVAGFDAATTAVAALVASPAAAYSAASAPYSLTSNAAAGATTLAVTSPIDDLTAFNNWLLELANAGITTVVTVASGITAGPPGSHEYTLTLTNPLPIGFVVAGTVLTRLNSAPAHQLDVAASGGDILIFASGGGVLTSAELVDIDPGNPLTREIRTVGNANSTAASPAALTQLTFTAPSTVDWPAKTAITPVALTAGPNTTLSAAAAAGSQTLSLTARSGINAGAVLLLGTSPTQEYAEVLYIPGVRASAGPDPGPVTIGTPLVNAYSNGATVAASTVSATPPGGGRRAAQLLLDAPPGSTSALVTWNAAWAAGDVVEIELSDGSIAFNSIAAAPAAQGLEQVQLAVPLQNTHPAGAPVVARSPLIEVQALDKGAWGGRIAMAVQDEQPGLVSNVQIISTIAATQLQLSSLTGIQSGSYLELLYPNGRLVDATTPLKVASVNTSATTITLDAPISPAQAAAIGTSGPTSRIVIRSREFRLTLYLYRHTDPAVPSRNTQIIQTETFRNLSMDPRHSQYFQTIIGEIGGPPRLSDGRPQGTSWLVRVLDITPTEAPRLGPEPLVDVLPNGLTKPAQHKLEPGDDSMATVTDQTYIGADADDPQDRTGIYAIQNATDVSIVAIPGQGTPAIQSALIDFCETEQYLFAVLDPMYPDSAIADIQAQRQNFDTKYAAIYYPWLTIPDPMPANLALVPDFPLPPSGHVVGIYARVDDSRGVFKAPANEVVQGITGLTRTLVQGDQDVLNPAPNNINVIRDFRPQGRGIRVWGARCITSDDNYKYVPVRRLLIFIELSLKIGLQDVVFEPNTPQLWATVERLIENFLLTVFNSGAFAGATPEQSYFVRCDQTTMTADDIDAGRLIALVGVAPAMPAEFVIIQIALMTATNSQ
jgi:hypothetical protein